MIPPAFLAGNMLAVNVLAVNVMVWVGLALVGGLVLAIAIFFGMRWLSDVSTARTYGWAAAGAVYATESMPGSPWLPLKKIYWSSSLGGTSSLTTRREMWYFYFNCKYQVSEAGLALRWGGRMRPNSEPKNHPILLFPWADISPGRAVADKGHGRPGNVVIIAPSRVPGVGVCFDQADASRLAEASAGRWSIRPSS